MVQLKCLETNWATFGRKPRCRRQIRQRSDNARRRLRQQHRRLQRRLSQTTVVRGGLGRKLIIKSMNYLCDLAIKSFTSLQIHDLPKRLVIFRPTA